MIPDVTNAKEDSTTGMGNGLISELLDIQGKFGYLPEEALRQVAEKTHSSLVEVYGVATFYRAFSLKPRGRHLVSCCLGTACHVRGAPRVADELQKQLGIRAGETTGNREFTLETVNCLGACALGPIVVIDGHYFSQVNSSAISDILARAREGLEQANVTDDARFFPVTVACPRCNHGFLDPSHHIDGHPSIKITISFGDKHGWLRLSSLWGSFNSESEYDVPLDEIVHIFCPQCNARLTGADFCPECGSKMVQMLVRGGGTAQICPRHGCKGHLLDLE